MINFRTVKESLQEKLKADGEILKDLADLLAFAAIVAKEAALPGALILGLILKTAGATIGTATKLMDKLSPDPATGTKEDHSYDRFRAIFYVLCQKSYFQALHENVDLKKLANAEKQQGQNRDLARIVKTFEESAAAISEAEVRFHFSLNPTASNIPLYSAYSIWLTGTLVRLRVAEDLSQQIASRITEEAHSRMLVSLSKPDSTSKWLRHYLALAQEKDSEKAISSRLESIREALVGWKSPLSEAKEAHSARWNEYRKLIQCLPDQRESMYNEDFGVSRVFVSPRVEYHRAGLPVTADDRELVPDLGRLFGALVSSRIEGGDLIILSGGPGSGKSTICRVLASELARDPAMHPIFLKLRRCRESEELSAFLEDSLVNEGVISKLSDLIDLPNVVLILDGFDELVLASKAKLKHFFRILQDDANSGPLRKAKIIVSGRDTLFPRGEGLPRGSHVLSVKSFDEPRVRSWAEKWRTLHETNSAGASFEPERLLQKENSDQEVSTLGQLASWPLTLHLLAKVHTAGHLSIGEMANKQIEKAYLYRSILRETSQRQAVQAEGKGRLDPEKMRAFLREIALEMYSRSVDSMEIDDIIPIIKNFFTGQDELAFADLAEVAIVNCPEITKGEETGFEFVHKSFSEYLVAECIAQVTEKVIHQTTDYEGRQTWHTTTTDAARHTSRLFGRRIVPAEIQELCEPMLGSFLTFSRGERVAETVAPDNRLSGLKRVLKRTEELYCDLVNASSLEELLAVCHQLVGPPISPWEFLSNYGVGIVLLGSTAARQITKIEQEVTFFDLEPTEGIFWRWLLLIHAGGAVDSQLGHRLYSGTAVGPSEKQIQKPGDWSLPIKIGLLPQIRGYQPELYNELITYRSRRDNLTETIVDLTMTLAGVLEKFASKNASKHNDPPASQLAEAQENAAHFIMHFRSLSSELVDSIIRRLVASGLTQPEQMRNLQTADRVDFYQNVDTRIVRDDWMERGPSNISDLSTISSQLCGRSIEDLDEGFPLKSKFRSRRISRRQRKT